MLSVYLCCLTPVHFRSQTYCWEREWGRRCSLTQPVKCFLLTCSTGSNRAGVYSTRANHITAGTASGMDLPSLEAAVQSYYGCGIASSTNRTYNSAKKRFITFCINYNLSPFPVSQTILCLFVSFLAKEGLQYQSIRAYLSAIRHLYISQGHPDPFAESNFPQLEYVLKGVRRSQGLQSHGKGYLLPPQYYHTYMMCGPKKDRHMKHVCSGLPAAWVSLLF